MPSAALTVENMVSIPLYLVGLQLRQRIMRAAPVDTAVPQDGQRRAPEDVEEEQGGDGKTNAVPAAHAGERCVEPAESEEDREARQVEPSRHSRGDEEGQDGPDEERELAQSRRDDDREPVVHAREGVLHQSLDQLP